MNKDCDSVNVQVRGGSGSDLWLSKLECHRVLPVQ